MSDSERKPLALVVDDMPEFRDRILRGLERLGVRAVTAANVGEACNAAAEHLPGSEDPLDLVILDMHMPKDAGAVKIEQEAGIEVLVGFLFLRLESEQCPVIVYTAYPSYENCVKALKAGAYAYIPKGEEKKVRQEGTEGGFGKLMELCKRLLVEGPSETQLPPTDQWLENNYGWLCKRYSDKWVAFVEQAVAEAAECPGEPYEGLVILSGGTREEVSQLVVRYPTVLSAHPPLVFVPGPSEDAALESEEPPS